MRRGVGCSQAGSSYCFPVFAVVGVFFCIFSTRFFAEVRETVFSGCVSLYFVRRVFQRSFPCTQMALNPLNYNAVDRIGQIFSAVFSELIVTRCIFCDRYNILREKQRLFGYNGLCGGVLPLGEYLNWALIVYIHRQR